MQPPKKNQWKEYAGYLWVGYIIAVIMGILFRGPNTWLQTAGLALASGFLFGTLFFAVNYFFPRAKFRSFWLTCAVRSLIVVTVLLVGMSFIVPFAIAMHRESTVFDKGVWTDYLSLLITRIPMWLTFGLGLSFLLTSFFQIDRKLGPGVMLKWLTGRYHQPREEERIFMFLDLKNSTTLAEKLGNLRFSRLCQEFFHDLSLPVEGTKGEVSHYIGDEAVLCWKPKNGLEKANCLLCFFYMQGAIEKRRDYYLREFGIVPEFKAGVHLGLVVAAEVGDIKSEIVYHGDVLNTTARITGLCSQFETDLLISGDLLRSLDLPREFVSESKGPQLLKGKEHEVEVVAIRIREESSPTPAVKRQEVGTTPPGKL